MSYWRDKGLSSARSLVEKRSREWSSDDIVKARKIIREGGTSEDVRRALSPDMTPGAITYRLKQLGIKPIRGKAHRGIETTLPEDRKGAA